MQRAISIFAVSGMLPVVALGAVFGASVLISQRRGDENVARSHARFAATLIAAELEHEKTQLAMIAQSPAFDSQPDLNRFNRMGARFVKSQPNWDALSLAAPDGRRLADIPAPISGTRQGRVVDRASFETVLRTGRPLVGAVTKGPRGHLAFAVRAPVIRSGAVRAVVTAIVSPKQIERLLAFEPLPTGWHALVVDQRGRVVATTNPVISPRGAAESQSAQAARRASNLGPYRFRATDGSDAIGVYATVSDVPWTVEVAFPAQRFTGRWRQAIVLIVLAGLICLVLFYVVLKLVQADLRQSAERERALLQAQRMESLGQLTGGIAHDFNNLLTPIIGGLDLLRHRLSDDPKGLRAADRAYQAAERAKSLVGRLLSFSRHQILAPRNVDLGNLFANVVSLVERSLPPGQSLQADVLPANLAVRVDPAQLEMTLVNLVVNARDAMPSGGLIRLTARVATAPEAAALRPGSYVAVQVSDTGVGMDDRTLQRVVEPFFTTKPDGKGTGLGLSMAHGFATQSGGKLLIKSRVGVGTTVSIILPSAAGSAEAGDHTVDTRPCATLRILLVDDDAGARETIEQLLASHGHTVMSVASAAEALIALTDSDAFDLVVSDYLMPEQNGMDLVRSMKARGIATPILIVTGFVAEAEDLGEVPRLRKPFTAAELNRCISTILPHASATLR